MKLMIKIILKKTLKGIFNLNFQIKISIRNKFS